MPNMVSNLAIDGNGNVIAVRDFTIAGSASANYVAKWDNNAQQWQAMGSGLQSSTNSLAIDNGGYVYVGGVIKVAGVWERHVLRWNDGTQEWLPLSSALDFSVQVLTTDSNGDLYHDSGAVLASPTVTFTWFDPAERVTQWWLFVGDTPGEKSYEDSSNLGTSTSYTTTEGTCPLVACRYT